MTDTMFIVPITELCQSEPFNQEVIIDIVDYGIVEPISGDKTEEWIFDTASVHWIKKAIRLHHELEIDWVAIAMIITLLKQEETLKSEIESLQKRLARFS